MWGAIVILFQMIDIENDMMFNILRFWRETKNQLNRVHVITDH